MPDRLFSDRADAGEALASRLQSYRGRHPLILAIPRGALPLGAVLARELDGELDVVLVHKLGAPFDPEYAIGAIDETGWSWVSPEFENADEATLEQARSRQLAELAARRARLAPYPPVDARGRVAIVVDDGLATGATMLAALHAVRARHPSELVCAVPVASVDGLQRVRPLADKTVCLSAPRHFDAVSQFYVHFPPVEDDAAADILARERRRRGIPSRPGT